MITALLTGLMLVAGVALAWTVAVDTAPGSAGYAKAGNLPRVTLSTVDVSAGLTGDITPDLTSAGCPAACGSVSVKFTNPSAQYTVHLSNITFQSGMFTPTSCLTEIFPGDASQAVNVTIPPSSSSSVIKLNNIAHMSGASPDSCAGTTFTVPIASVTGTAS